MITNITSGVFLRCRGHASPFNDCGQAEVNPGAHQSYSWPAGREKALLAWVGSTGFRKSDGNCFHRRPRRRPAAKTGASGMWCWGRA